MDCWAPAIENGALHILSGGKDIYLRVTKDSEDRS